MHLDKSSGPDGMTPDFYQKFWKILNAYVVSVVKQCFDPGIIDKNLIKTNIALIPKKKIS